MLLFKLLYLLPALIVGGGELFVFKVKIFLNLLRLPEIKAFSQPLEAKAPLRVAWNAVEII